jgi:hypothetical protein
LHALGGALQTSNDITAAHTAWREALELIERLPAPSDNDRALRDDLRAKLPPTR